MSQTFRAPACSALICAVLLSGLAGCGQAAPVSTGGAATASTPSQQAPPTPATSTPTASSPSVSLQSTTDCTVSVSIYPSGSVTNALINFSGPSAGSLCAEASSTGGLPLPGDPDSFTFSTLPDNPTEAVVCQIRAANDGTTGTVMDTGGQVVGENLCAYLLQYG